MTTIKQNEAADWFHCRFCALMFTTYDEFRSHTYRHFNTKTCPECYVLLIQICDDEWFSLHTTSNCQHSHQFTVVHSADDSGMRPLAIKQELEPDINSYLTTEIEMNVTNGFHSVFIQHPNTDTDYQSIGNIQLNGDEQPPSNEMVEHLDKNLMKRKKCNRTKQKSSQKSVDEQIMEILDKGNTSSLKNVATDQMDSVTAPSDKEVTAAKSHSNKPNRVEEHMRSKPSGKAQRKNKMSTSDKAAVRHMCSVCGRQFPDRSNMRSHERTHFGIKLAECTLCKKSFCNKSGLRKHMKVVHEKQRPHSCDIDGCEWTFGHSGALKRHKARRHGMVTHRNACPICFKEFPNSTYHLNRHLKAHANNTAKEYIPTESKMPKTVEESKTSEVVK